MNVAISEWGVVAKIFGSGCECWCKWMSAPEVMVKSVGVNVGASEWAVVDEICKGVLVYEWVNY